jgi:hypothetical protein
MSTEAAAATSSTMPTLAILNACRDLMLHRSNLQLAAAFDRLADILLDNAAKEYAPRVVGSLLDARSGLLRLRASIAESFAEELTLRLNGRKPCGVPTAPSQGEQELSLQSADVLDEYVSARTLARSIESTSLGELPVFHQKIAFLKRMPALRMEEDPFSPQSVVSSLLEAMQSVAETTPEMRLFWLRALAGMGGMGYADVYSDLNRYLTDAGVALQKPRAPMRPPPGGPGGGQGAHPGAGFNQQSPAGFGQSGGYPPPQPQGGYQQHPQYPQYPQGAGYAAPGAGGYEQAWAAAGGASEHYPGDPYSDANNQYAQMSMQPDAVPLQQLATNLMSLVERLQHVVPGISGGPAAADPSLWAMVRNKEAMQISAALGFAANGAFRAPLVAGVDRKLMSSLTDLQLRAEQPDFSGAAPAAAPRTVLRDVVPGYSTGDISVLDATTTELVAMLFDFVLERRELRSEIKVLLGRLQIPMLKAAMVDRGFFSRKNHPGRQLLNRLADAGLGWSPDEGVDDPLFRKIHDVIDHISRDFVDDLGIFTVALVDLEQFVAEQELDVRPTIEAETADAVAADRHIAAVIEAKQAVDARVSQHALPEQVKEFIEVAWQPHLQDALLEQGKDSGEYAKAVEALDELIWSVTPKEQPAERAQLSQRVPSLVKRLREGLKSLSNETVAPFFDKLFEVHSGLLRGAKPDYVEPEALPEPSNDASFDPFRELVKQMERNQWIEMSDDKGALTYAKLAWMSPQGTTYLFTTRHGRKAASLSPEELAEWFRTDKARMIESEPIVDRALAGMFQANATVTAAAAS